MAKPTSSSAHLPVVRDGLCRFARSKGMLVNLGEPDPRAASFSRQYLTHDPNALPFDTTIWWCEQTSKSLGPDDGPCASERCVHGRSCYESEPAVA